MLVDLDCIRSSWGQDALAVAHTIVGWGEEGANNRGPEIDMLRHGRVLKPWQGGAWCADTCYFELSESFATRCGYDNWLEMPPKERRQIPVKWTPSARRLGRRIAAAGCYVDEHDIRHGDFVVYPRKRGSHIAIVSMVGYTYSTIDGNRGRFNKRTGHGSKVREFNHEFGEPVRFFCRLP